MTYARSFILLMLVVLVSCGKYEEGPGISLRSKKKRITGEWKIERVLFNGDDITTAVQNNLGTYYILELSSNGTFHESGKNVEDKGTWKFAEGKLHLILLSNLPGAEEEHAEIIKLKNTELWLRHAHGTHVTEFHYTQ